MNRRILAAAVAVMGLCAASTASAADVAFTGPAATPAPWDVPGNWTGGFIPTNADVAYIENNAIAVIANPYAGNVSQLVVAPGGGSTGEYRQTGGSLALLNTLYAGAGGSGTVTLQGGAFSASQTIVAGNPGSSGRVFVSSGVTYANNGSFFIGLNGTGQMDMSGGQINSAGMNLGQEASSQGVFNMTGGTVIINNAFLLGEQSNNNNVANISGGVLTANEMYGSANKRGTVNVSGTATVNIATYLHVAAGGGSNSTLTVSGGALNMTGPSGWILVGQNGNGTALFSGGQVNTKIISVGQDPASTGTAIQTGGVVTSEGAFIVGEASQNDNKYTVTGGTVNVGTVGAPDDGFGIYIGSGAGRGTLSIGTTAAVNSVNPITVGLGVASAASGTIVVNGGALNATGTGSAGNLRLGVYAGATGNLRLSSGTVTVGGTLQNGIAGVGDVTMTGGALTATATESDGTYSQSGGTASLGAVSGAGTMSLAAGSARVTRLTQSSLSVTGGSLIIANSVAPQASIVASLTTGGSGVLDLTNNGLIIDYSDPISPLDSVRTAIGAGRIVANLTPADSRQGVAYVEASTLGIAAFLGTPVDANSVVMLARLKGDADVNGTVNLTDFSILAANFGMPGVWTRADFDYNGTVNLVDFSLLASTFGATVGDLPRGATVPEPTLLMVAPLAAATLLRRRR